MNSRIITFSVVIILICFDNASASEPIQLTLESDKAEYIIKEPLRFKLTFKNVSGKEQRLMLVGGTIPQLDLLEHIIYSIKTPEGKKNIDVIRDHIP